MTEPVDEPIQVAIELDRWFETRIAVVRKQSDGAAEVAETGASELLGLVERSQYGLVIVVQAQSNFRQAQHCARQCVGDEVMDLAGEATAFLLHRFVCGGRLGTMEFAEAIDKLSQAHADAPGGHHDTGSTDPLDLAVSDRDRDIERGEECGGPHTRGTRERRHRDDECHAGQRS